MSTSFLSRWSRLKEAARRKDDGRETKGTRPGGEIKALAAEPELTNEEIAALPKLDELTARTDVTVFLRRGVPEALRNAALRKIWMLDPEIRDFVGHARDYDYDWNMPGGAPGHGALEAGDDVAAMVRRVFGESDPAGIGRGGAQRERIAAAEESVPAKESAREIEGDDHA